MLAMTRIAQVAVAAALSLITAQEAPKSQAPTLDERLQALIEKTNGLDSFRAEYRIKGKAGAENELRISYSKPARLAVRMTVEGQAVAGAFSGTTMKFSMRDSEHGDLVADVECLPIPPAVVEHIFDAVRAGFPGANVVHPASAFDVFIGFTLTKDETGEPKFVIQPSNAFEREALLGWLTYLRKKANLVQESAETLTFEGDHNSSFVLQKATGFIESARAPLDEGEKSMRLVKLEIDVPVDSAEFEVPELGSGARDVSDSTQEGLFWLELRWVRYTFAAAVVEQVEQSSLHWDDAARSSASKVFLTVHASIIDAKLGAWVEQVLPNVEAWCWWFQSMRAQAGGDDEKLAALEAEVEKYASGLRRTIDGSREAHRRGGLLQLGPTDSELWIELAEIDRSAFEDAFSERLERRMLDPLEQQLQLAREGKLKDPAEGKALRPEQR